MVGVAELTRQFRVERPASGSGKGFRKNGLKEFLLSVAMKQSEDSLSRYFDKVYVINLTERTDRLAEVSAALERVHMPFTAGKVERFSATKSTESLGFPSPGVRGCFLSHLAVLRQALEQNLASVLVLEDDVEFSNCLPRVASSIGEQLNNYSWSFAYLGYYQVEGAERAWRMTSSVSLREYTGEVLCCHAYAVSSSALPELVAYLEQTMLEENGRIDIDGAFNNYRIEKDALTLLVDPQVAWQRASHSDIHEVSWRRSSIVRKLFAPPRKRKNFLHRLLR